MILKVARAKLTAYALPIFATLVVVVSLAFWWLWSDRQSLLEDNANLMQAMDQAKVTNEKNRAQIEQLEADIRWRDQQAVIRSKREKRLSDQLAATESELEELVKDAPCSGPEYLWPDAVYKRMRINTVADPNRVQEGLGARTVPGTEDATGSTSEN
ncbi:hypothetical protein ACJO2E_02505 [Marinobacter sp. M1N3S26]|uniref:hypothetical protein n=1 Tax=Marinobacter sp. M1N3S26 TaxID=3382299 RepID=UPI00387AA6E4